MKTLIFNGSPRKNGNIYNLVNILTNHLTGECKVVDTYYSAITPCVDCRYCSKKSGCSVEDEWQEIDCFIKVCDNILIASPIYFSELTGPLLSVTSRVQSYWSERYFRHEEPIEKPKRGGIILVGGGDGSMSTPVVTATCLLKHMNAQQIAPPVCYHNTNSNMAANDETAIEKLMDLAAFLNWHQ